MEYINSLKSCAVGPRRLFAKVPCGTTKRHTYYIKLIVLSDSDNKVSKQNSDLMNFKNMYFNPSQPFDLVQL